MPTIILLILLYTGNLEISNTYAEPVFDKTASHELSSSSKREEFDPTYEEPYDLAKRMASQYEFETSFQFSPPSSAPPVYDYSSITAADKVIIQWRPQILFKTPDYI